MKKILSVFAIVSMLAVSLPAAALTSGQYLGGQTYSLAGSGISSSASSITLTSLTLPQNGYKILDSDLDAVFHVTIEPGNRTRQEFADCTTVTQNGGGTATLSGCTRGMSGVFPYTASSTQAFSHSGGSTVVFSNTPSLYYDLIQYANSLAFAGAPDATTVVKGLSELATGLEIAASTANGGSGPLVIPASLATSTYNAATAGNKVVVTGVGGTIDSGFVTIATSTLAGSFPVWQIGKQFFISTTTGTSTFPIPSGITKIAVETHGGGGGGGTCSNAVSAGGGGGAGGDSYEIVDVTGTSSVQYFIGTGGAGAAAGGWTVFGTNGFYLGSNGGSQGENGTANQGAVGGSGGSGFGGDINYDGTAGGHASYDVAQTNTTTSGEGGGSKVGGGAKSVKGSSAGNAAGNYGSGGSGGACSSNFAGTGGSGSGGALIIRW